MGHQTADDSLFFVGVPILTTPHAAKRPAKRGFREPVALRTWSAETMTKDGATLTVTSLIYLCGDTLVQGELRTIRDRYPRIDLAVIHLGGTKVFGLLLTMDGRQGVDLVQLLAPRRVIPVHYDDYGVLKSPLSDFVVEMGRRQPGADVTCLCRGETSPWARI